MPNSGMKETQPQSSIDYMRQLGAIPKPEKPVLVDQYTSQAQLPENKMDVVPSPQGPTELDKHNYGMDFVNEDTTDPSKMTPEVLAALAGIFTGESAVEKIVNAPSPEQRKYWIYDQLGRIVDFNESWPAQSLREAIALRVSGKSDALLELTGETLDKKGEERKKGNEQALSIIQDVDKVFDQWYAVYKQLSPSGKIFQMVFNQLPEFMPPEVFARIFDELPGIKENVKEWKSVSEQIDIGIRAFIYIGLQSDPRLADELEWYKQGDAFTKLQENTKILIEEPNPGRPNPFAPLGNDIVADATSIDGIPVGETPPTGPMYKTTTKNATSITQTSAVLNASLDQALVGSIRYFEYGTSAGALTKTTSQVTQSGQGDFGVTISGLSSNKTYYFRSVLSVGDVKFTGDVLSFKTK
jgi:hypothetical protein